MSEFRRFLPLAGIRGPVAVTIFSVKVVGDMGSPTLEAMCSSNSLGRRVRKIDVVGRLKARSDHYLWLFGQIHAKVG